VRLVLACAFLLHYVLGASVGFSVDEAHYALYATHMALSYFDHPPLVGWVQWPLVALEAPVAVLRWWPQLLWLGTALLVFQIAERLQTPSRDTAFGAGFWGVLVLALAPLLHVLGIGLLPDTLLMFLTALLMWQTLGLMHPDALSRKWAWVALGLVLGLAGLSKYTAIFAALAVAWVLLAAHVAQPLAVARCGCSTMCGVAGRHLECTAWLDLVGVPNPARQGWPLAGSARGAVFGGAVGSLWPTVFVGRDGLA
jgi:4-amino-4-deoxy-L-arabinose transferase-like glycosyltransferase